MLNKVVDNIVNESLDWFLESVLQDHYDNRRQALQEANKSAIPAIDYILKTCLQTSEVSYPPESAKVWNKHFRELERGTSKVFKQLFLVYLKLDLSSYLSHKNLNKSRSREKSELASLENALNKLQSIPHSFDFPNSIMHLSSGLWGVDNEATSLVVSSLSNLSINLSNYFEVPREVLNIIVDSLIICHQPRIALLLSKIHRYDNWDEDYNGIYAFLLISSGQLIEALKYERLFTDRENYSEILQRFFKLCSEWDATKSLNCLNLSIEEEDVLNQHFISESRPVTPSGNNTTHQKSVSKSKPRNRSIQVIQRQPSFNDSPARNTRSARKKKPTK